MGGQEVHQHVDGGLGVVVEDSHNAVGERLGVGVLYVVQDSFLERVVHNAVELTSNKVAPANAVALLVGGVFPDFAVYYLVAALCLDSLVDVVEEFVRQLVGYIKTPALRAEVYPLLKDTVFAADVIRVLRVVFVDIRESGDSPPAFVFIRIAREAVPGIIRAVAVAVGSGVVAVSSELVKVDGICAGVRENAVKYDAYSHFLRFGAEFLEVLLSAEQRVYLFVVRGVVAVVLVSLENRVEVDHGSSQALDVWELLDDSLKVAAEIVVVADYTLFVGLVVRRSVPVVAHYAVGGDVLVRLSALAKAVGEYLVHDSAADKQRGVQIFVKYGELEKFFALEYALGSAASLDVAASAVQHAGEVVVMYSHVVRREAAGIDIVVAAFVLEYQLNEALLVSRAEHDKREVGDVHCLR